MAVERLKVSSNITALAKELGVPRMQLYRWLRALDLPEKAENWSAADGEKELLQQQIRQVRQLLGEKTLEVDFLQGALQRVAGRRQESDRTGARLSTNKSGR